MREEVGRLGLPFAVVVQPSLSALAATGERHILVAAGRMTRKEDVERTVMHEIEAHAIPRTRAAQARLAIFQIGTARGIDDQEGLALVLEERGNFLKPRRKRELAARHLAVEAMDGGATFADALSALVKEHGLPAADAVLVAERAFRGGDGTSPGLGRERIYLEAFLRVERASREEADRRGHPHERSGEPRRDPRARAHGPKGSPDRAAAGTAGVIRRSGLLVLSVALALASLGCPPAKPACGPDSGASQPAPPRLCNPHSVVLVRHAEKATDDPKERDPELAPKGRERAARLATLLGKTSISRLVATEYKRTQHTLGPLSERVGEPVEVRSAAQTNDLVRELRDAPAGSTIVVATHSNVLPMVVRELGGPPPRGVGPDGALPDDDYSRVLVVSVGCSAAASVVELSSD